MLLLPFRLCVLCAFDGFGCVAQVVDVVFSFLSMFFFSILKKRKSTRNKTSTRMMSSRVESSRVAQFSSDSDCIVHIGYCIAVVQVNGG